MGTKYVVVRKTLNTVSCMGIFDSYVAALGAVMNFIFKLKKDFTSTIDLFEIDDPYELEPDEGIGINIRYALGHCDEVEINFYILNA